MKYIFFLFLICGLLVSVPALAVNAPVLFFSDLTSGPASGNSDTTYSATGGVYVTLYGDFLTSPTVTLNGASCLTTVSAPATWMWYQKMTVKLGTTCTTGNFVVSTAGGTSNGLAFTVRSGNIFYASGSGNDSTGTGSFSAPWRTLLKARGAMAAGDTTYAETGSDQTTDDGTGWNTCMLLDANAGTAGNYKAMVGYPGQTVTIGNATASICPIGIRSKATSNDHWVFAELTLRGRDEAINPYDDQDWRIIGNDISCPNTNTGAQAGCVDPGGDNTRDTFNYRILGNNIHHAATNNSSGSVTGLYHGFYLSEKHHDVDIGWNTIAFVMGGRCLQVNVNVGPGSYDLHIHDNVIHDCPEDGIVITTVDPHLGTVELYNNVIYNAGQGPEPFDGGGAWNCINVQGWSESGVTGESGTYQVYSNTMYACGTFASPPYASAGGLEWQRGNTTTKNVVFRNNIIYQTTGGSFGFPYFQASGTDIGDISGSNNLFFGNGTPPTQVTSSVNSNPGFVSTSTPDLHLALVSSPANGAGTASGLVPTLDHDGLTRPSPPAIGGFEFSAASSNPVPPAPATALFAAIPLPAGVAPVISSIVPTQSYVTSKGCSQDGLIWDATCPVHVLCLGCSSATAVTFDGTPITAVSKAGELDLKIPLALLPVPSVVTQHKISLANPIGKIQ